MDFKPSQLSCTGEFRTSTSLEKQGTFPEEDFLSVMQNLIVNPNILSSHLFRADILWDSDKDTTFDANSIHNDNDLSSFVKHMKKEFRPWKIEFKAFRLRRTVVRQLIPRNPQLDKTLVQTCHFFSTANDQSTEEQVVIYVPHADTEEAIPWYHPPLRAIVFRYGLHDTASTAECNDLATGTLSIDYKPFDMDLKLSERTQKSLLNLLNTVHKHSTNHQTYSKRVHHDQIIPQKRFQDTYARLKTKHAKQLIKNWREQTNVSKGVFEDLAIAAFLIELWRDMYSTDEASQTDVVAITTFPGFVDLACGNGCLVYILRCEGYTGWGLDARSRKTWDAFPADIRECLKEMVLMPSVLSIDIGNLDCASGDAKSSVSSAEASVMQYPPVIHDGVFPAGTFLISNHADELTPWTAIIAYLNSCPFIAIPCCSHALDGSKYRYPHRYSGLDQASPGSLADDGSCHSPSIVSRPGSSSASSSSGDLAQSIDNLRMNEDSSHKPTRGTSSYAALCGYIAHSTRTLGYEAEREVLRIPSTRNTCIVGRHRIGDCEDALLNDLNAEPQDRSAREEILKVLIAREAQKPLEVVAKGFWERAIGVYKYKGRNH